MEAKAALNDVSVGDAAEDRGAETWAKLTDVERTAIKVCQYRALMASQLKALSLHWDATFDSALVAACMPKDMVKGSPEEHGPHVLNMMLVRTVEIDQQALAAVNGTPAIRQVVILGAGLDPRAWRLAWPQGTHVFEVDTGSVERVKQQVLGGMPMAAASRVFVAADLAKAAAGSGAAAGEAASSSSSGGGGGLAGALATAGFKPHEPCLWIMEGLIGYLTNTEGQQLLQAMYEASAAGSRLVMTAPPTKQVKEMNEAQGRPLHHVVYDEPEEMLAKVQSKGWTATLISAASLSAKYGVEPYYQAHIIAHKEGAAAQAS